MIRSIFTYIKNLALIATVLLLAACPESKSDSTYDALRSSFLNPDNSAKPGVYWYFMDGNQIRVEMTADLESMKKVGIEHMLFLEAGGIVDGQWHDWILNGEQRPGERLTFPTWKHYTKDSPLQSSGLLGPVTIKEQNTTN